MDRPLKFLVIEDDADQRDLIRETLLDSFRAKPGGGNAGGGATVVAVGSKAQALAQDVSAFNLILSDYNLPDATGLEVLAELRARCATPVIMVTGENVGQIAVDAIRKGATDYVVKTGDYLLTIPLVVEKNLFVAKIKRENEQLRLELEKALQDVCDKNTQLERSLQRVEELAATDPLTGLYNRRHFGKVLDQLFAESQRYDKDMSCVMIDLDKYKQLNDSYGHQIGDELLILAGKLITANMRRMDVAARYGGDEFVLLLPQASATDAQHVAQRIQEQFKPASAALLGRAQGVSMSIGIGSIAANRPTHADQLVAMADVALYRSKEAGRDRISFSSEPAKPLAMSA
jgi:two-component system cell cycle response regulator